MIKRARITFFLVLVLMANLWAHEKTPSYLKLTSKDNVAEVSFKCPVDRMGNPSVIVDYPDSWRLISRKLSVIGDLALEEMVFEIPGLNGRIEFKRSGFNDAAVVITLTNKDRNSTLILDPKESSFHLESMEAEPQSVFRNFTFLGVEHILLGIDHLLFVLALLFLVKGKQLIAAVTAFTVAHSITLVISTLKVVAFPSSVVEALIAFSIVLMAVEVFKPLILHNSRNYVAMAFFFGLLHGFGFAGVLSELGLPEGNLLMALFSFNLGVELGQLVFIGAVLILMPLLERFFEKNTIVEVCSYVIGSIGAFWFLDRTIGVWFI